MTVYVNDTEADLLWWKLWESRSLEELRLKCSVYGVDMESWLVKEGALWKPRYEE